MRTPRRRSEDDAGRGLLEHVTRQRDEDAMKRRRAGGSWTCVLRDRFRTRVLMPAGNGHVVSRAIGGRGDVVTAVEVRSMTVHSGNDAWNYERVFVAAHPSGAPYVQPSDNDNVHVTNQVLAFDPSLRVMGDMTPSGPRALLVDYGVSGHYVSSVPAEESEPMALLLLLAHASPPAGFYPTRAALLAGLGADATALRAMGMPAYLRLRELLR